MGREAYCHNCGNDCADDDRCDYCHEHACDACRSIDPINHWNICDYCLTISEEDGEAIDKLLPLLEHDEEGRELLDEASQYHRPGLWLLDERDETGSDSLKTRIEQYAKDLRGLTDAA